MQYESVFGLCIADGIPRQNRNFTSNARPHDTRYHFPILSAVANAVREADIITPETLLAMKWPTGKAAALGDTLTTIDTVDEPSIDVVDAGAVVCRCDRRRV